jgi:coenzyme Q-binding protein COQ10
MPKFSDIRPVQHSATDMFALVADVENYPQFLPLCEALTVKKRSPMPNGRELLVADMTVSFKLVRETYTSKVIVDPAKLRILVEYLDGPFRNLDNRWTFHPVTETSCDVEFYIDYEFRSRTLQMLMGTMFDQAFHRFSDAFVARADVVYGRRP